jgi:hypothetical protein
MASMVKRALLALLLLLVPFVNASTQPRSHAAKLAFQREHPCPANGARRGRCPGYQIDHKIPLHCDGPDSPDNMQWLTIADHAAKTKREHNCTLK